VFIVTHRTLRLATVRSPEPLERVTVPSGCELGILTHTHKPASQSREWVCAYLNKGLHVFHRFWCKELFSASTHTRAGAYSKT